MGGLLLEANLVGWVRIKVFWDAQITDKSCPNRSKSKRSNNAYRLISICRFSLRESLLNGKSVSTYLFANHWNFILIRPFASIRNVNFSFLPIMALNRTRQSSKSFNLKLTDLDKVRLFLQLILWIFYN